MTLTDAVDDDNAGDDDDDGRFVLRPVVVRVCSLGYVYMVSLHHTRKYNVVVQRTQD